MALLSLPIFIIGKIKRSTQSSLCSSSGTSSSTLPVEIWLHLSLANLFLTGSGRGLLPDFTLHFLQQTLLVLTRQTDISQRISWLDHRKVWCSCQRLNEWSSLPRRVHTPNLILRQLILLLFGQFDSDFGVTVVAEVVHSLEIPWILDERPRQSFY